MEGSERVQTGWKISKKAKDFVSEFAKRTRMGQADAADYLLSYLADNPDAVMPPTEYAARFVQNGSGYALQCQEKGCGEAFHPTKDGDTVEALAKWTEKHKHETAAK